MKFKDHGGKLASVVGAATAAILLLTVPKWEGTVNEGYKDPIGIVTACVGHTKTAELGRPYTDAECEKLLIDDLVEHAEGVKRCVKVPLTKGQLAASVSFTFNIGITKFCKSTMVKKFNAGDYAGACAELSRWTRADGKVLRGLVERRKQERAICERPD